MRVAPSSGGGRRPQIRGRAGAGLKGCHAQTILENDHQVAWFEAHAENYMVAGGPRLDFLERVRERFPVSLHGVAMSLGGAESLDPGHLLRFRRLVDRFDPVLISEHLAWSSHAGVYHNDLLPVRYDEPTLARTAEHVEQFQTAVGRIVLIENPSTYVSLDRCSYDEVGFLTELARRTGCGLLLDVNNLFVSATNHGWDVRQYLSRFPLARVRQIHVAGHATDTDEDGSKLLIDSHDRPVAADVWDILDMVLDRTGPLPVLVEWDEPVPSWIELEAEVVKAQNALNRSMSSSREAGCA